MAKQMTNINAKNKCSFCRYHAASGCMVTPNSYYCREAQNEFYAQLATKKQQSTNKGKKW